MAITNYPSWETELLETGLIVQNDDLSVAPEKAEQQFNRYVALVDLVDGSEGQNAARALVKSLQSQNDYGAYQNTMNKLLFSFPPEQTAEALVSELPRLISHLPDWAGDLLSSLTQAQGVATRLTFEFNLALKSCGIEERNLISEFIHSQEGDGWLEHKRGILGV